MTNGFRDGTDDDRADPARSGATVAPESHPAGATTYVDPMHGTPVTQPPPTPGSPWAGPRSTAAQPAYDRPPPPGWTAPWPGQATAQELPAGAQPAGPPASVAPHGGLGRTLVIGLVAGLLGGLLGGVVGHSLADREGSSIGVLGAPLPEADPSAPLGPVEAVAQRVLPSVVQLRVRSGDAGGEGSGIVLSADGLVLTNNHVVDEAADGASLTALFQDGTIAAADIVGRDPSSDIAVIRVRGVSGLTPIELGNSDAVRVGQQVVAIGSPQGLEGTVTTGIISALNRTVTVGGDGGSAVVYNGLQTDAPINQGNSGGPLVDLSGHVVGINSAIATAGQQDTGSIGLGFAIPIDQARRVAQEILDTGVATKPVLGVQGSGAAAGSPTGAGGGATIQAVTPGSPAAAAGLAPGDTVVRVGDARVADFTDLVARIGTHAPGDTVTLTVRGAGGGDRPVTVTLAGTPDRGVTTADPSVPSSLH